MGTEKPFTIYKRCKQDGCSWAVTNSCLERQTWRWPKKHSKILERKAKCFYVESQLWRSRLRYGKLQAYRQDLFLLKGLSSQIRFSGKGYRWWTCTNFKLCLEFLISFQSFKATHATPLPAIFSLNGGWYWPWLLSYFLFPLSNFQLSDQSACLATLWPTRFCSASSPFASYNFLLVESVCFFLVSYHSRGKSKILENGYRRTFHISVVD